MSQSEFDRFANSYETDLARSLAATGEGRDFYAERRIDWTAQCVSRLGLTVREILDFGCGDGNSVPMLLSRFGADRVIGVDVSSASITVARESFIDEKVSFRTRVEWEPDGKIDLAYANGVFHHVRPSDRMECLMAIRRALRGEGLFAFWENNPWNPGTRYVMSQCAFDEDAITISPLQARIMLSQAGFRILKIDSHFYFPRQLQLLRAAEQWLRAIPLGGQYQVLCQPAPV